MIIRRLLRGFMNWDQYQAQLENKTLSKFLEDSKKGTSGAYETWKEENSNAQKLKFILDHCNPEEQKLYLKNFSTEDLGRFLLKEVNNLSSDEVNKFNSLSVKRRRFSLATDFLSERHNMPNLNHSRNPEDKDQETRKVLLKLLEDKLRELHWRSLDKKIIELADFR